MSESESKPHGRPPHQPTQEQRNKVRELSSYGIPQDQIASSLGITHMTLRKHYMTELTDAKAEKNLQVSKTLFHRAAIDGDVNALKFWCQTQMGWSHSTNVNHQGGLDINQTAVNYNHILKGMDEKEAKDLYMQTITNAAVSISNNDDIDEDDEIL